MYNKIMASKTEKGFTIIEVILFLAVSGAIVAGIIATTSSTLSRRRYDDSVQDFVSHLREVYSDALNTQLNLTDDSISLPCSASSVKKMGNGRSDCVVYGVIATIDNQNGEVRLQTSKLVGKEYDADTMEDQYGEVILPSSHTVNLDILGWSDDPLRRLVATEAVIGYNNPSGLATAISGKVYRGRWGIKVDDVSDKVENRSSTLPAGKQSSFIIFRDPKEGNLVSRLSTGMPGTTNELLIFDTEDGKRRRNYNFEDYDDIYVRFTLHRNRPLYFCVTPGTGETASHRRLIRIDPSITNESAVQLIDSEDENYEGVCD